MRKLYVLVGVPAAGKSTWVAQQSWAAECVIVSTDHFVQEYAKTQGKTYNQVFKEYMPTAVRLMAEQVVEARENGRDIIWDQTSTTAVSRKKKFTMLPDYYAIAVVFSTPEPQEHQRRLDRPGKSIPWNVLNGMIATFQEPTEAEGFEEIWRV